MNNKLALYAVTVALAGFIFGFDTVVISGANLPIKELWQTTPFFHGFFIMSSALWGTVIGSLLGAWPCDVLGRKRTLFWIGVLYLVSAIGSALAPDPFSFSFFRFIGGVGIGISTIAAPIYIAEISPPAKRGFLTAMYQFMIVFGILVAFISNYLLAGIGGANDWRYMMGIMAIPSIVYCILLYFVPESPRWLLNKKNDVHSARSIMHSMGISDVEKEISDLRNQNDADALDTRSFWSGKYRFPIMLAFLLAFFNQLSGINFILYYAPEILESAGIASKDSLFSSIAIGGINLLFTMLGVYLIDRAGRKQLMYIGSIGYIISLLAIAYAFKTQASSGFLMSFILLFIASHAIGQGAVIWVFLSEIFPTNVRALGTTLGCSTHWVFAAIITLITPLFLDKEHGVFGDNPWPIFAFFGVFMILQLLFTAFMMPETKGKSLEQLSSELTK